MQFVLWSEEHWYYTISHRYSNIEVPMNIVTPFAWCCWHQQWCWHLRLLVLLLSILNLTYYDLFFIYTIDWLYLCCWNNNPCVRINNEWGVLCIIHNLCPQGADELHLSSAPCMVETTNSVIWCINHHYKPIWIFIESQKCTHQRCF